MNAVASESVTKHLQRCQQWQYTLSFGATPPSTGQGVVDATALSSATDMDDRVIAGSGAELAGAITQQPWLDMQWVTLQTEAASPEPAWNAGAASALQPLSFDSSDGNHASLPVRGLVSSQPVSRKKRKTASVTGLDSSGDDDLQQPAVSSLSPESDAAAVLNAPALSAAARHRASEAARRQAMRSRLTTLQQMAQSSVPISNQAAVLDAAIEAFRKLSSQLETTKAQLEARNGAFGGWINPADSAQMLFQREDVMSLSDSSVTSIPPFSGFVPRRTSLHSRLFLSDGLSRMCMNHSRVLDANEQWLRETGHSRADLEAGLLTSAAVVPSFKADISALFVRTLTHGSPTQQMLNCWKTKSGGLVFKRDLFTPLWSHHCTASADGTTSHVASSHLQLKPLHGSSDSAQSSSAQSDALALLTPAPTVSPNLLAPPCSVCGAEMEMLLFESLPTHAAQLNAELTQCLIRLLRALDSDLNGSVEPNLDLQYFEAQGEYIFDAHSPSSMQTQGLEAKSSAGTAQHEQRGTDTAVDTSGVILTASSALSATPSLSSSDSSPPSSVRRLKHRVAPEWRQKLKMFRAMALAAAASHTVPPSVPKIC
jgi:hypothetical protein